MTRAKTKLRGASRSTQSVAGPKLPKAIGPYSSVIKVTGGATVYVAGMTALNAAGEIVGQGDEKAQARQVIENIRHALESVGGGLGNVVRTAIYLMDISHFADVNKIYSEYFKEPYPARVTVQVAALPRREFLIEIDAVAVVR